MRINNIGAVAQIYNQAQVMPAKAESVKKMDKASFSTTGKDFQYAMEQVKKTPDVRWNKVEDIKARIQAGTYKVSAEDIAKKMMQGI